MWTGEVEAHESVDLELMFRSDGYRRGRSRLELPPPTTLDSDPAPLVRWNSDISDLTRGLVESLRDDDERALALSRWVRDELSYRCPPNATDVEPRPMEAEVLRGCGRRYVTSKPVPRWPEPVAYELRQDASRCQAEFVWEDRPPGMEDAAYEGSWTRYLRHEVVSLRGRVKDARTYEFAVLGIVVREDDWQLARPIVLRIAESFAMDWDASDRYEAGQREREEARERDLREDRRRRRRLRLEEPPDIGVPG